MTQVNHATGRQRVIRIASRAQLAFAASSGFEVHRESFSHYGGPAVAGDALSTRGPKFILI